MKKQPFLLFPVLAALAACAPTVANRGCSLDPELLAQIKPGATTREEVAQKLGTPTSISTFDENVWYYVGRQTEQYSFLSPDVLKQQAIEIDFDDKGVVTAFTNLDLPQAADATPVDRATPTFGQQNTFLRELLGDLSHPRPNLKNQRGSGT
jgi:outer membrane protein assembly factor BamE (lipoprotein component of BamABCDE complex)